MALRRYALPLLLLQALALLASGQPYQPNWDSLDKRPLPSWYDQAKFGIFIHWGVFSVPSYKTEWYWWNLNGTKPDPDTVAFHNRVYGPNFRYADFAPKLTAEFFDPDEWAELFKGSGAKYIVLTSKHHEGFTLYPSGASWNWNSVDTGPHLDILALLSKSVRAQGLVFGAYHSLFEWFNPLFLQDRDNKGQTQEYVDTVLMPELHTLINNYQPEVLWSDGDWEMNDTYWRSTEFLAWLYNESPVKDTIVTNDRWGAGDVCKHGGYWTCSDRYQPGHLINHKWENCFTVQAGSWGYDRRPFNLDPYHDVPYLLTQLASTVAFGGNFLLNVGPTSDGRIVQAFRDRLLDMGAWLNVNGEAIYSTTPWQVAQNQSTAVFYTKKPTAVYAILTAWPANNTITLTAPQATAQSTVNLLGYAPALKFSTGAGITVELPALTPATIPCQHLWTLKLSGLANN